MTPPLFTTVSAVALGPAVGAAMATVAIILALRGRRVDDHPICRKCRFDLHGRPTDSTRCPECGADLSRRRAVRRSNRVRRRRLAAAALAVFLLSAGGAGLAGWGRARGVDWARHKPAWWLARDAGSPAPAVRDAALAELARRAAEGRLPASREAALVEETLAHQADQVKPWVPGWGRIVEAARAGGRVSDEQWERYQMQAVVLMLRPEAPVYRRCDRLRLQVVRGPDRSGGGPAAPFDVGVYADGAVRLGGQARPADVYTVAWDSYTATASESSVYAKPAAAGWGVRWAGSGQGDADPPDTYPRYEVALADDGPFRLDDGPQAARVTVILQRPGPGAAWWPREYGPRPGDRRVELRADWTMALTPPAVDDAGLRAAVERAVSVKEVRY